MSQRANFYLFNYQILHSLLGSSNEYTWEALHTKLVAQHTITNQHRLYNSPDVIAEWEKRLSARLKQAERVLRRALFEPSPFWDVSTENRPYVDVAELLAFFEQDQELLLDFTWHVSVFADIADKLEFKLGSAISFLRHLVMGRPLFGERLHLSGSYYAYLLNEEVRLVKSAFETIEATDSGIDPLILRDFHKVLDDALATGKDLWMHAG